MAKAEIVRKTFTEAVKEILDYETRLKEVVARPPSEEASKPIETVPSMNYKEALAEVQRLQLVRRLGERSKPARQAKGK